MPESHAMPVRVFVVGDEERVVSMVLRQWGNEVDTVDGRAYPICEARRFQPDLVLIDIGQRTFDGCAHVRRFRRRAEFGAIPLAVYADFLQNGGRVQVVPTGGEGLATKALPPVELARVLDEIRQLIVIPNANLLEQTKSLAMQANASRQALGSTRRTRCIGSPKKRFALTYDSQITLSRSRRVVLFERQGESLHSIAPCLRRMGAEVLDCVSPDECVDFTRRYAPDFVVLNSGRPAYLGYEMARRIQQIPASSNRHVVRISSADDYIQDFLAAEVDIVRQLTRPLRIQDLVNALRELEESLAECKPPFTVPGAARTTG